ncbi:MAG: transcriptional repressor [Armatimonadetes bacterium]|nr:transcriptional repressor [Armatimonadota bacterium]
MEHDQGLQITQQRQAVLRTVQQACGHIDAGEVYQRVRRLLPRISLGTVYRALGALRDAGLIYEIVNSSGPALYDGNLNAHQHIICRSCGKVEDMDVELPVTLLERSASASGFSSIEQSRIDFHGICQECASARN